MSKFYVEAYYADGTPILGNLDGQGIIYAKSYKRTLHYKELVNRKFRESVAYHQIICANTQRVVETIKRR